MKVGFLQFNPQRENVENNVNLVRQMVEPHSFDLLVLPELANSGYFYPDPEALLPYAELIEQPGIFLTTLLDIAAEKKACIVSGIAENVHGHIYNSAVAISPDGILTCYHKIHLYNTEKKLFSPGQESFQVFEYNSVKIGLMICFDWIFPESARTLALDGAQIIAHPANLVLPYCQSAMLTRSVENGVYTITANRIGEETLHDQILTFTGKSQVTGTRGQILISAPEDEPLLKVVDIDPSSANNKSISPQNDLFNDRVPNLYFK